MADSPDFAALAAAGIADPRQRADLIKYLAGPGFTVDEMVEAERRDRLFGLAGDVLQWSGRPIYTLQTAAERLGLSAADVAHAWGLLGLTVAGPDVPALSQADVDALSTWVALKGIVGEDGAFGLLRVLGDEVMWVSASPPAARPGGDRPRRTSAGAGGGPAGARRSRVRHRPDHQRGLLRRPRQPGRAFGGGRGARPGPGLVAVARGIAGLARSGPWAVEPQGFSRPRARLRAAGPGRAEPSGARGD